MKVSLFDEKKKVYILYFQIATFLKTGIYLL